jgi:hypothetical protein
MTSFYLDLLDILKPENKEEADLLAVPEVQAGLRWGLPRYGHPEGEVYKHVREVLDNIDKVNLSFEHRALLRLVAIIHDAFKYIEPKGSPRNWSKHHSILAAKFMEKRGAIPSLVNIITWHDEAYYIWRMIYPYQQPIQGQARLDQLLTLLGEDLQLYYVFFKCDTSTGDKNSAPLKWFEKEVKDISLIADLNFGY